MTRISRERRFLAGLQVGSSVRKKRCILLMFLLGGMICLVAAQQPPFYNNIRHFKELDRREPPPKNAVLFIGSSSFTKWTDVQDYFPEYKIINRGFGGSTLPDLIYYFNDLVPVYRPRQVVIYCGENDLANSSTPADSVVARFKRLYALIRLYNRRLPVAYISMKPSPSRSRFLSKFITANDAIKTFISTQKYARYISIYEQMLSPDGNPRPEIFERDHLHMNAAGYQIWQKEIRPYLKK
ncbi:MAG TPA: GDSL-type esterase/lipase family protein [Niabella sp.]